MKPLLLDWVWEGFLVILAVYLSAVVLRSAFASIIRKKVPLQLGLAAVCAIYTAVTWTFYYNYTTPLSTVLPWLGLVFLGGMGLTLVIHGQGERNVLNVNVIVDSLKPVAEFFVLFVILAALYAVLVPDRRLPVVIVGNNDIWAYAKFSHLALNQPMGNNIVNFDMLKTSAADQAPTAYTFLAGLAHYLGQEIVDILSVGLILILTTSAYIVKKLCVKHWYMQTSLAYLIAIAWVTSSFSFYLASNYFLAQWLGICLFLITILFVLSNEEAILIQTATLSLLNYLTFMTYPALFFPYMGILLFLAVSKAMFARKNSGTVFFNPGLASAIFSIPLSLGIAFAMDPGHFKKVMLLIVYLSSVNAGWPHKLLNPVALTAFPVKHIDSGILIFKMAGYLTVIVIVSYLTYKAHKVKSLSSSRFAVSAMFIAGLLSYLCYYALKGASYQQWKLAGSMVFPLSFIPIAAFVGAFDGKKRISVIVKHTFLILLIGLNVFFMYKLTAASRNNLRVHASLRELTRYDQNLNLKTINVDFKDDFAGAMIAAQFVNQKPLVLWSPSYYSKSKPINCNDLSEDDVIVTNDCSMFDSRNLAMLGESFSVFKGAPRLAEDFSINFNKPLPSMLSTAGLSGQESWGRWSDGHKVVLDIPINTKREWVELTIKGVPFVPRGSMRQRMSFWVRGKKVKEFSAASETEITIRLNRAMFDDNRVKLVIDLPDAVSPSEFGSTDTRVLGFGFHTLEVRAMDEK